jgi:hypothetical protein
VDDGTASTAKQVRHDTKPQPDNQVDVGIEDVSQTSQWLTFHFHWLIGFSGLVDVWRIVDSLGEAYCTI